MDKVRIGIVGLGGMGSHHARYLAKGEVPDAELTAVADIFPDKLEKASSFLPESVKKFDSIDAMLDAGVVDAVMIATLHYDHPPSAIKAFEKGVHVLSEKPAGVHTKHVKEMNAAAAASGKVFSLMFNQRTRPIYQKLRDLIESGELGEIRRTNWIITDWYRSQSYYNSSGWRATWAGEGGGVLINQCTHNLDVWQWTCGMPKRLRASCYFGKYHDIEVEDDVTAYVEYENGATGLFITTTGEAPGSNRFEVTGDRGKVVVENEELSYWRCRESVSEFTKEFKGGFGTPEIWKCDVPLKGKGEQHKGICKDFVKAILEGTPLLAKGEEGLNSVQLANAMLLSAWTDSWVDIPIDDDLFHDKLQERIEKSTFQKEESDGNAMNVADTF